MTLDFEWLHDLGIVHDKYTMGFRDALDYGIDYRQFKKVAKLPVGVEVIAIAGVWDDNVNIRCLFVDREGKTYRRHIQRGRLGYTINELGVDAKEIDVGAVFTL